MQGPREFDASVKTWESVYECEAEALGYTLRRGTARGSSWGATPAFTIFSDEPPDAVGGGGFAPTPLTYLTLGVLFCEMSELAIYARMLRVRVTKIRARGRAVFRGEASGSVRKEGRRARMIEMRTHFDIESPDESRRVAQVIRLAKNGCYGRQALLNPVPMIESVAVNGVALEWQRKDDPEEA